MMLDQDTKDKTSKVSIIVPVYNRAHLISDAIESVLSQSYDCWELILIDDGSTDDTQSVCREYVKKDPRIRYLYQENNGPYAARNTGLDAACGRYIAFLDSDDQWCRHHLSDALEVLEQFCNIDIVFGALKRIDLETGRELVAHGYYPDGKTPHPLIELDTQPLGKAKLICDKRFKKYSIRYGFPGALHCMVYRREVFARLRFNPTYRTVWDRIALMQMVFEERSFAYFDAIHLIYRVHDDNISTVRAKDDNKKLEKSARTLIQAYTDFLKEIMATDPDYSPAVRQKIAELYAWYLGSIFVDRGEYHFAAGSFKKAIEYAPLNLLYYKAFISTIAKHLFQKTHL